MSYDNNPGHQIWVGDLDDHINLDEIFASVDAEERDCKLNQDLDEIGDIVLFSGRAISSHGLISRGITPERWRWAKHEAEKRLGTAKDSAEVESAFVNSSIGMGRRYAVARYSKLERLSFSSAITAIFPHGIRALLYQYMGTEPLLANPISRKIIQDTIYKALSEKDSTAYYKTGLIREKLHDIAIANGGSGQQLHFEKNAMRVMLSLCRLHFSILECQVSSISEIHELNNKYILARRVESKKESKNSAPTGKFLKNWRMRHLHPVIFYFPYAIRYSFARLICEAIDGGIPTDRATAVNELALMHCGIELMRHTAKTVHAKKD